MAGLAENSVAAHRRPHPWRRRLGRAAALLVAASLMLALAWWLRGVFTAGDKGAARQVAKITILPDTPPPPPPPPPREPPPRPEPTTAPQAPAPQPQVNEAAPQDAPLRMEGAAGDGPSAFAAGPVTQEYQGGVPQVGGGGGAQVAVAVDRAQQRLYAASATPLLRDELERHLRRGNAQVEVQLRLWIDPRGAIERFEVDPSGDPGADAELTTALAETQRALRLPAPPAHEPPLRFRLTLRLQG
jgi:outer membrane biosynthesis protein TonB